MYREQLAYFQDIDYSEKVEYMETNLQEEDIKNFLTETAITSF